MANNNKPYYLEVSEGTAGHDARPLHKFGRNAAVSTSFVPINLGGHWRTPLSSSATTLRIAAGGNANDTTDGTGAREVTIVGYDANGDLVTESIATAGASASASTTTEFFRLCDAHVSKTGTYATASAQSHAASITLQNTAGTETWGIIDASDYAVGRTETATCYVPNGQEGFIHELSYSCDTANKVVEVMLLFREDALSTSAPYKPLRFGFRVSNIASYESTLFPVPLKFPENSDVAVFAKVDSGADIEVHASFVLTLKNKK